DSGASLANAVSLRSMCPVAHSGHWSMTLTRTEPSGPCTSRYPPHPPALLYSEGDSATNSWSAGGVGEEQVGSPVSTEWLAIWPDPAACPGASSAAHAVPPVT